MFPHPVGDEVVEAQAEGEAVLLPRVLGVVYLWELKG